MSDEIIDVENDLKSLKDNQGVQNFEVGIRLCYYYYFHILNFQLVQVSNSVAVSSEEQEMFDFAVPGKSTTNKNISLEESSKYTYPTQMINPYERENWIVSTDHCYARPWNWRPETSFLRPTKTLFISKPVSGRRKPTNPLAPIQDVEDVVDVETLPKLPLPIYDVNKVKNLMEECENYTTSTGINEIDGYWEDKIVR